MLSLKTIDAHAAGEPLRLIVGGFPSPHGKTMLDKREWVRKHADHLRKVLMLEPRGHADMYGAILTEPVSPGWIRRAHHRRPSRRHRPASAGRAPRRSSLRR